MRRTPYKQLPRLCSSWLQKFAHFAPVALSTLCLAASGCSFGKDEAAMEQNTCQVDSDCATQHCDSGRCVAEAERAMDVTVVVTPKRAATSGGQAALPIVSKPFSLSGGSQTIELRLPISVPVRVVYKNKALPAQASFTPVDNDNRFLAQTTTLTLLSGDNESVASANQMQLLDGMTYRVVIQPSDVRIPAHSLLFTASSDAELAVDYAEIEEKLAARRFLVRNASRLSYQVRAVSELTGAPISDMVTFTGSVTSSLSPFTLRFDDADVPYRLEFAPPEKQSYSTGVAGSCGDETPQPSLSVPSRLFKADLSTDNRWYVDLPELHPAVEYSGVVGLCDKQKLTTDLQVTLETHDLYLASGDSDMIRGAYDTAAAATWDPELSKFRFCARVPPGTYTVSVKPSPTLDCELFAEKRVLRPDWSGQDELGLRTPAMITANVLTPDRMPMAKVTVDVQATSGELMRAPEDRTVGNYNRSASVTTGADGSFTLNVDRGRYDVFVKPPEASNYAWRVIYDVAIAAANAEFATEIMLSEPVAVTGKLQFIGGSSADQQTLADAEVRAYTLVNVEGKASEQRSVQIGSGVANASGTVTLLLPPGLQHSWNP